MNLADASHPLFNASIAFLVLFALAFLVLRWGLLALCAALLFSNLTNVPAGADVGVVFRRNGVSFWGSRWRSPDGRFTRRSAAASFGRATSWGRFDRTGAATVRGRAYFRYGAVFGFAAFHFGASVLSAIRYTPSATVRSTFAMFS